MVTSSITSCPRADICSPTASFPPSREGLPLLPGPRELTGCSPILCESLAPDCKYLACTPPRCGGLPQAGSEWNNSRRFFASAYSSMRVPRTIKNLESQAG